MSREIPTIAGLTALVQDACKQGFRPALSYERISDEIQADGVSLGYQERHATAYASAHSLQLIHSYGIVESAHKEGRRVFNLMLDQALELGIQDLIFKNIDRMSRNYQDLVRIDKLIDDSDFRIHFYQNAAVVTRESSYNDRFLIGIQLAVAKHASDKISQDVRDHNLFKAENGIAPFPSPYGYRYDAAKKMHFIDQTVSESCRFIFDSFDTGDYSTAELVSLLNEKGVRTAKSNRWHKSSLHHLLSNPFYHGEFVFRGRNWNGAHEPYYDRDRYLARKKLLQNRYHGQNQRKIDFLLTRFLRCSCGRVYTGDIKKGRYIYYRHICRTGDIATHLREEAIFRLLDAEMKSIRLTPDFGAFLSRLFRAFAMFRQRSSEHGPAAEERKISKMRTRKHRLLDLYASERIAREDLEEKVGQYDAEIRILERKKNMRRVADGDILAGLDRMIQSLEKLPELYEFAEPTEKAAIWKQLAKTACLKPQGGGIHSIQWQTPVKAYIENFSGRNVKRELQEFAIQEKGVAVRKPSYYAPPVGLEPTTN